MLQIGVGNPESGEVITKSSILLPRTVSHLIDYFNKPERGLSTCYTGALILKMRTYFLSSCKFPQPVSELVGIYLHSYCICVHSEEKSESLYQVSDTS